MSIPDAAIEAAAEALQGQNSFITSSSGHRYATAALYAAMPAIREALAQALIMTSDQLAAANARIAEASELLDEFVDWRTDCILTDAGCELHGYVLEAGEKCPHQLAKEYIRQTDSGDALPAICEALAQEIETLKAKPTAAPGSDGRAYQLGHNKGLSEAARIVRGGTP